MSSVVEVRNLRKTYGTLVAVDDLSFEVEEGEIFGMVGPNGAGKTTTIECIEGLRRPDGGSVQVLGIDPSAERLAVADRIGVQLQESALPPRLRVGEALKMDISMSAYTALILGTVGLLSVPITISGYREAGVLRRFQATPMRPGTYILADIVTNLVMTLLGMIGLVFVGWLLYRVQFEGQVVAVVAAVIFCGLAMFSIGYVIASLAPGARTAQVIGMVIFYPMMFLSGAAMPLEIMPETIQRIAGFLPLTYVVKLLRGPWFGEPWREYVLETAVLGGVLVVCTAVAARFFRWE